MDRINILIVTFAGPSAFFFEKLIKRLATFSTTTTKKKQRQTSFITVLLPPCVITKSTKGNTLVCGKCSSPNIFNDKIIKIFLIISKRIDANVPNEI
ncbi:hypothetical protein DERP_010967 [Dermatophagoides pteronyssinus]|uniref:Uncharacterized protein n=1 Tax=Dermatophagoides pteronyssinus TaxID=6956 RepID=A0ABQ8JUT8_DERPT|nr:hypothetical protein DERP_010967 [Dermatophagoides pteronyssinus]